MNEPSEEVKEVERRYEATIDKMQQLVDRLKIERMSQAEFEQYAKEHGYIISTTNIIEQIRDEIEESITDYILNEEDTNTAIRMGDVMTKVFEIIDRYREEQTDAT